MPPPINALGLKQVDLLGFSIGDGVTQALTLVEPQLVRRPVLVGTGPRSGGRPLSHELNRPRCRSLNEDFPA
jgi:pimeloyl-ACP methyl ester carboxylesterase